jgi:hypothetical protein
MPAPMQMFEHCLDELKGWPDESAVDFDAHLSPNVSVDPVFGGTVVHVNQQGQFELGAKGTQMPIFLLQGSHEFDVSNPGGNTAYGWTAINPTGKMSGLVAIGGYELETTEFEQATGLHYYPNDILHAPTEDEITGPNKVMAGKLFKRKAWNGAPGTALAVYTNHVCALVSRRDHLNHHRVPVVTFWPVFIPGAE